MDKNKENIPKIRFPGFTDPWEQRKWADVFVTLPNNSLSRAELNTEYGIVKNIHYGDVLIKYREILDVTKEEIPYISNQEFKCNNTALLQDGDIIIADAAEDETVGKCSEIVGLINQKIVSGLHTIPCRPTKLFSRGYLGYYMNSGAYHDQLLPLIQGTKVSSISKSALKDTNIIYPDLEEQEKIGAFFNQLDNLITLHQRKLNHLKDKKKGLLQKMFPKEGERFPEIRFPEFTEAWEQRKLRDVADRYDNLRIPVAANLRVPGTTPYYGANGIQDYVDGFTHEGEFVLVAEDGANDLKNYPVKCVKGRIWVNNHAHVVQGKKNQCDNKFLAYSINRADIESLLVGGGRAKLNAEVMMGIDLLVPKYDEQKHIGIYFEQFDNLITLHQRKLNHLQQQKKGLLQQMFI